MIGLNTWNSICTLQQWWFTNHHVAGFRIHLLRAVSPLLLCSGGHCPLKGASFDASWHQPEASAAKGRLVKKSHANENHLTDAFWQRMYAKKQSYTLVVKKLHNWDVPMLFPPTGKFKLTSSGRKSCCFPLWLLLDKAGRLPLSPVGLLISQAPALQSDSQLLCK